MNAETREYEKSRLSAAKRYDFDDLVLIMALLREPGGCDWDREQTHDSIRNNLIEETYEVIEAIDTSDPKLLREELGDLLLQIIFHARIEEEEARFSIDDVISDICAKLVHRHPHVFGTVQVKNAEEVLDNWEAIKKEEKRRDTLRERLSAIPPQLPSLIRAEKISKKTAFWEGEIEPAGAMSALSAAMKTLEGAQVEDRERAMGELLYATVRLCRAYDVKGETALSRACDRRVAFFDAVEQETGGSAADALSESELIRMKERFGAI